ncbi:metallophosphoesterase [Microbacterium paludicola]|uniref:Metallophosphoesterase n=1 Tax=Microbacterium paludicola TaxID=300019 RepID=A0A4Y9FXA8_9MICO|nr:metallophosphoesterase family protein [Microbacterium paludicola]MBF0815875.1 metallophosphoesterase family protein [Microbacterium paludicola]TFU33516.1 metallophosphoesterase [Microbacterium paludicola]
MDRLALISDVHGNLGALEAVLDDIAGRGITRILNLGDVAGKGPRGSAAVDRVAEVCELTVRGNWDDFLETIPDDAPAEMVWWRDELRPDQRRWLRELPLSLDLLVSGRRVRLFHASAESPHLRVHFHHTPEQFDSMFANTEMTGDGPAPVIVGYGDIHDAYIESHEGRTLFNVGSVGNPLDEPTPSYVILEGIVGSEEPAAFGLQFVRVPYDVEAEIQVAERLEMPRAVEWASELRTARYRGASAPVDA